MAPEIKEERKTTEYGKGFERYRRKKKRNSVKRKILTGLLLLTLCVVFLIIAVGVFFRVSEIRINGNVYYKDQDIIDASGIEYGKNIYLVSSSAVSERIVADFPFVKKVDLSRKVPSTVVLDLECDDPMCFEEIEGEYFLLSSGLHVLDRLNSADDLAARYPEVKRLVTSGATEVVVGRDMVFDKEAYAANLNEIVDAVAQSELFEGLTTIDVSDRFNIVLVYAHTVKATLGDSVDLDLKLRFLGEIIKDVGTSGGTIDIENVEMGYHIPSSGERYD